MFVFCEATEGVSENKYGSDETTHWNDSDKKTEVEEIPNSNDGSRCNSFCKPAPRN